MGPAASLCRRCRLAGGLKVAVNLSPMQFKNRNLVDMVASALKDSGLSPDRLELEITETVMLQDTATTLATLHGLHALGLSIAMDDFGTGYSSLTYLRRFPFDRIKIDQSFVRELGEAAGSRRHRARGDLRSARPRHRDHRRGRRDAGAASHAVARGVHARAGLPFQSGCS